jgi:phosphotransferase system enzyme I (PtsI)
MVSFALHGVGVSGGIAIGRAQLVSHATLEVAHYTITARQVPAEIERFTLAVHEVQRELEGLHNALTSGDAPGEFGAFLDVHWMILNDATLSEVPKRIIAEQHCNAEWALTQQMGVLVEQFEQIEDSYLRERKADVVQVGERVLKRLMGRPGALPAAKAEEETILVAHDLSPADVIQFKHHHYGAFLTDLGGVTSHTAIVARSLNVPAVVATHNARALIRDGELLIVDGSNHVVIVNPDRAVLAEYRLKQNEVDLARQKLKRLRTKAAETLDGVHIELLANIELPDDLEQAVENGASGIGLFRSEFLFLNRDALPTEDEQFEAYRSVAKGMKEKPVTIRTFDLGADKQAESFEGLSRVAPNPALGLRAVRFCLAEPKLFLTQLRAILRASHYGNVQILVPMLASASEIDQTLAMIARAKESLREQGLPFNSHVPVGGMIEIPAAVLAMGAFARLLSSAPTSNPVHACRRSRRRGGVASLRSAAPGGRSAPGTRNRTGGQGEEADRRVRRDGGRDRAHADAARHGPAPLLHASGASAERQAARAAERLLGSEADRRADPSRRRPAEAPCAARQAERMTAR